MLSNRGLWARFVVFSIGCFLYAISLASNISSSEPGYDHVPITPKTWEEVDLSYFDMINGDPYPGSIQLLRPIKWLHLHDMDKVGNVVTLSIPEFSVVDVKAQVVGIKPTKLDTRGVDWTKMRSSPVIGRFQRYAPIVKTYTFRNLTTGKISTVDATPNHPFYVKNKKAFVPSLRFAPNQKVTG